MAVAFCHGFLYDEKEELVCNRATALVKKECKQETFVHSSVHVSALLWNAILKFKQEGEHEEAHCEQQHLVARSCQGLYPL